LDIPGVSYYVLCIQITLFPVFQIPIFLAAYIHDFNKF